MNTEDSEVSVKISMNKKDQLAVSVLIAIMNWFFLT
jgi:hypothetical protein